MARYLITGGAGFIGSNLAHTLAERQDTVRILDDFSGGRATEPGREFTIGWRSFEGTCGIRRLWRAP